MKKFLKYLLWFFLILVLLLLLFLLYANYKIQIEEPKILDNQVFNTERHRISDSLIISGEDWLKLNDKGLYEMKISGSASELGVKHGLLAQELTAYQEEVFVDEIKKMIPSESYLNFLKYFIGWFNRDINEYIPLENRQEIYCVSQYTDDRFDFVAPKYQRILNYHGAHDIGHALQNMNLVACTAFGTWNGRSADSSLIIGRNFDFYVGDRFAEKKIIAFVKPDNGYAFASVSWGGLTGVLSGMNEAGLSISLNSAKSDIPLSCKTPVSIVARQILQYCSTIEEAYQKAQEFDVFVAESFMIGSAKDGKASVIEKTPEGTALYNVNGEEIILTNHFQSEMFFNSPLNIENMEESASVYRYKRVEELLNGYEKLDIKAVSEILRNQKGLADENIGLCNEKAVNQLIAHHSIIFKPEQLKFWISTNDFQLGEYICYDLKKVFSDQSDYKTIIRVDSLTISEDAFINSKFYQDAQFYRKGVLQINKAIANKEIVKESFLERFIASNPMFFHVYKVVGDYYAQQGYVEKAIQTYQKAIQCELPRRVDKTDIEDRIKELREN